MQTTVTAHANIALIKYWGKRDETLNLPAASSLSVTLSALSTVTTLSLDLDLHDHQLEIDGRPAPGALEKARPVLDLIFAASANRGHARIRSTNNFPTCAGLASSASGLAALTVAAARATGLDKSPGELSAIARRGSGSATRSLFGGYVIWDRGQRADGNDSRARQIQPAEHWDLRALICVISSDHKSTSSSDGMRQTAASSPFHAAFVADSNAMVLEAEAAIANRDFEKLTDLAEASCLRMHANMMAGTPPLIYLQPQSWELIHRVRQLRKGGLPLFFTADAGPNVKVFGPPDAVARARAEIAAVSGVERIIESRIGGEPQSVAQ